ncbi:MAG: hypothetical protein ABEJ31_14970 [Haloarculaceae archaeon]
MAGAFVTGVWLLDRGTALVALPALWIATLTGVFVRTRHPATMHALSRHYHTELATFGLIVAGMHGVTGTLDALLLGAGLAPPPQYPGWLFAAGVALGALSLGAILLAVASFLAPWRFENPSLVHAGAYVGFGFGVVHAVAIGTDVVGLTEHLVALGVLTLAAALVVKFLVGLGTGIRQVVGV